MADLRKLIVSGLGTGYLPVAPGTWASAVPCAVFLALAWALGGGRRGALGPAEWSVAGVMALIALASSAACVALGRFTEATFGRKDPHACVIDEWAGQATALLLLPLSAGGSVWVPPIAAFAAFRLMDIIKPPPARRMEKLPAGWGVLLDDLVAGVYANAIAQLILRGGFRA